MDTAAPVSAATAGTTRSRLVKIALAVVGLALLWTVLVGVWLPRFAQLRIEAAAAQALGTPLSLGRLEIAPWSLRITASGVVLGPPEAAWLKVEQVHAALSIESVWRVAPVLRSLSVQAPQLRIERLAAQRFNFTPMLEALARRPAAPADEAPARFAVHNIRIADGRIDVIDRVTQREHHIEALQIGVPFISNLPSKLAIDVEPLLDARINGSRLQLQGKTQPFNEGRRSAIAIDWQQLDLALWAEALAPLLPAPLPLKVAQGELALALQLAFEQHGGDAPPLLRISGGAQLAKLRVAAPAQGVALAWDRLTLEGLDVQPFERRAALAVVRLQAPDVRVDLQALLAADRQAPPVAAPKGAAVAASAPAAAASAAEASRAWQWRIDDLQIEAGSALVHHPAWPQDHALTALTLAAKQLDSRTDAPPATLNLSLKDARSGTLSVDATVRVGASQAALSAKADGVDVAAWLSPWQPLLPVRVLGMTAALSAKADVAADRWAVSDGDVTLAGVTLQPASAPASLPPKAALDRLDIARIALGGIEATQEPGQATSLRARTLAVDALDLKVTRQKTGTLGWLPAPSRAEASASLPNGTNAKSSAPHTASPALRWQLDELRCTGCAVGLTDQAVSPPAVIGFARTELTLRAMSNDLAKPIAFELATQPLRGGRLQWRGTATPQPLAMRSRVDVAALDLRMLQPYLQPQVNLELVSARLDAAGELSLNGPAPSAAGAGAPLHAAQWRGKLGLAELRTLDALTQAELLRFKTLKLEDAQFGWRADAPLQADLGTVTLQDFYGRVILDADGRLNLQDIARRGDEGQQRSLTTPEATGGSTPKAEVKDAPTAAAAAAAAPPSSPASAPAVAAAPASAAAIEASRPQLRWRAITLGGGTVDFTDNFIRPNYSAKLTDLSGSVAALAWNDPAPATIAIAGKVDGSAPLEISGSMHPLGPRLATDITASARGIDITRLTGYSARYAGYGIEKGTLSVKVHYKIAAGQLEADNNLYLDQLTFGDKVDSPNALNLPVRLAVSLLQDRHGVIDLNLPIRGSLDDPQFSIGGLIVKVIVNLITKAITAPFSLLAGALGGSEGPALSHVDFAPGASDLSDASRQQLDALAKALDDRPALRLEATGHADAAHDDAALRTQHLDALLRAAKARSTGELPDSVKIEPAERTLWLAAAYKDADLKDKPRNLIGLAKSLPPAEMEALLLQHAPAGEAALRQLADERGNRVKAYLVTKLPPERVLLTASRLGASGEGAAGPRVDFALR